jgi:hypothetical protein
LFSIGRGPLVLDAGVCINEVKYVRSAINMVLFLRNIGRPNFIDLLHVLLWVAEC